MVVTSPLFVRLTPIPSLLVFLRIPQKNTHDEHALKIVGPYPPLLYLADRNWLIVVFYYLGAHVHPWAEETPPIKP